MGNIVMESIAVIFCLIAEYFLLFAIYTAVIYKKTNIRRPGCDTVTLQTQPIFFIVLVVGWIFFAFIIGILLVGTLIKIVSH